MYLTKAGCLPNDMIKNNNKESRIIRIASWNVNGLRAIHKKGFTDFIKQNNFDIVCLQETKVPQEKIPDDLLNLKGYFSYFSSAERPGYSGVAIYSKIKPFQSGNGFGIPRFDNEGRVLWLDFEDFILFNTYMPNGGREMKRLDYKLDFYDSFLKYLEGLIKEGRKVILTGDVNTAHQAIDLARPKQNEKNTGFLPEERDWIDRLLTAGFTDAFRFFNPEPGNYTWWDYKTRARERNIGWRLDYFFASNNMVTELRNSKILHQVPGSDHCPIVLEFAY
jgi:exodeoxyribonuclease-3